MVLRIAFYSSEVHYEHRKSRINSTMKGLIIWHVIILCHCISQYICSANTMDTLLFDLSHEYDEDTINWVTTKQYSMNVTHYGTAVGSKIPYWYQIEEISTGTHAGTHLDAPCHFAKGKWCVSDIPIERLVAPVIIIDISDYISDDPTRQLMPSHLENWENTYGTIPNSSLILVRTGWARFYPNKLQYAGTSEKNASLLQFPSISPEAAQWIVDKRNVVGVGIDTMSVDDPKINPRVTHQILEERNIYGIENVNNQLNLLPPKGMTAFVMPMKLKAASGAPCRLFVMKNGVQTSTGICNLPSQHLIILLLAAISFYLL